MTWKHANVLVSDARLPIALLSVVKHQICELDTDKYIKTDRRISHRSQRTDNNAYLSGHSE